MIGCLSKCTWFCLNISKQCNFSDTPSKRPGPSPDPSSRAWDPLQLTVLAAAGGPERLTWTWRTAISLATSSTTALAPLHLRTSLIPPFPPPASHDGQAWSSRSPRRIDGPGGGLGIRTRYRGPGARGHCSSRSPLGMLRARRRPRTPPRVLWWRQATLLPPGEAARRHPTTVGLLPGHLEPCATMIS